MNIQEAYRKGFIDALRAYGIWKKGIQKIGCMEKPVCLIIAQLDSNPMFEPPQIRNADSKAGESKGDIK